MPLYRCTKCGCVENTALGWFHCRNMKQYKDDPVYKDPMCSECTPSKFRDGSEESRYGKWHDSFKKSSAAGWYVDTTGYIWETAAGSHCFGPIIGKYAEDGSIIPLTDEEKKTNEEAHKPKPEKDAQGFASEVIWTSSGKALPGVGVGRKWVTLSNKKSKQKKKK